MNVSSVLDALGLPAGARVDHRVPKKLLAERGAPIPADRRHINAGIEELRWVATLKPTTVGVEPHQDAVRHYLEIAVLTFALRPAARAARLIELVHRAVPYPVLLLTSQPPALTLSLAHIRWSLGEYGRTVLEDQVVQVDLLDRPADQAFLKALPLARQPRTDMYTVYQGWIDCVTALLAARLSGTFSLPRTPERAAALREALANHTRLQRDITALRSQAAKERQIARRVELNLQVKRLEAEQAAATDMLKDG